MNDPAATGRRFPVGDMLELPVRHALLAPEAAGARQHLLDDIVGWVTTVSPDGRPQTAVIPFLWDGDGILFYSRPDTPKIRNIDAHPAVSFHLNCDPYGDHILVLDGRAVVAPHEPRSDVHRAYRAKYREPFAHWGIGERETANEFSVPIRIHPERVRL